MSKPTLEERVAELERQVAELKANGSRPSPDRDWKSTWGMFTGDEVMKSIMEEGRKIREADRRRAKQRYGKARRNKR